ncbi:MAG: hypothetical protein K2M31_01060 [Muribaculaceae bacterium]|nr:hypothetical protein [Muribaculaceae bacterium]
MKSIFKKIRNCMAWLGICSMMLTFSSCDTAMAVLAGVADGMNSYAGCSGYGYGSAFVAAPSATTYSSSYSSGGSGSSSTCRNCGGTGNCRRCNGAGRIYDYGAGSISSKGKYEQRCPVCNGSGKCGACN